MEKKLYDADEIGIKFYTDTLETAQKDFDEVVLSDEIKPLEKGYIDILDTEHFNKDYSIIHYCIPFLNVYDLNDDWINSLERYLKRKLKVFIRFTGSSYPSPYMKNQILKIIDLKAKYNTYLSISHNIKFEYASFILNNKEGVVDRISHYSLNLKSNLYCIRHEFLKIINLSTPINSNNQNIEFINYSLGELRNDIEKIVRIAKDLDTEMEENYGLCWLKNGQFLNEPKLKSLKLVTNADDFSTFTKDLNSSLIEVLHVVGKEQGLENYFFNDFKKTFPKLFESLNRLRVYRNSMQHNDLDASNLKTYNEFVQKDLNGQFPEFVQSGYLILQKIIVEEILNAIKNTSQELSILSS